MKIETIKKIIGWFLISFGLVVIISSFFIFYVPTAREQLTTIAIGLLICLAGVRILNWGRKGKRFSS
jgi:hypothetical protein